MKPSRFTEEQIARAGSWGEDGGCSPQIRVSSATFYKWKAKYGGLDVSDAKRLTALEDENRRRKKLLAAAELDKAMLKEIAAKNGDARCQASGRRPPSFRVSGERAAGVFDPCR